jgi:hypothetical protein
MLHGISANLVVKVIPANTIKVAVAVLVVNAYFLTPKYMSDSTTANCRHVSGYS